jgi:hypothetical protein
MVTSSHKPYIALALGDCMRAALKKAELPDTKGESSGEFTAALNDAVGHQPERFFVDGTPEGRQDSATSRSARQDVATPRAAAQVVTFGPDINDRLPTIPSDKQNRRFTDYADPTPLVIAELEKFGISASGIQFERWDDVVANWGGNYTNHLLRVSVGGRVEDYSIELALRSPKVTAVEIMRQMGRPLLA